VSNDYDVYHTVIVINLIYDAVLADSEPPQPYNAAELFGSLPGERIQQEIRSFPKYARAHLLEGLEVLFGQILRR